METSTTRLPEIPSYFADIEGLLDGWRQGSQTDIIEIYIGRTGPEHVHEEYVDRIGAADALSLEDYRRIYYDNEHPAVIDARREMIASKRLFQDLNSFVANSEDDVAFADRIDLVVDFAGDERNKYKPRWRRDSGYDEDGNFFVESGGLSYNGGQQTQLLEASMAYFERHPESDPQAIATTYASAIAKSPLTPIRVNKNQDLSPAQIALNKVLGGHSETLVLEKRLFGADNWLDFGQAAGLDMKNRRVVLALYMKEALSPTDGTLKPTDLANLTKFPIKAENKIIFQKVAEKIGEDTEKVSPGAMTKLTNRGVELFKSLLNQMVVDGGEDAPNAANVLKLLDHIKQKTGHESFRDFILLANAISPKLEAMSGGASLETLVATTPHDLPKAIDRLTYFALSDTERINQGDDTEEVYSSAAECASSLVEIGVNRKLEQSFITLGDIAMRRRTISPAQVKRLKRELLRGDSQERAERLIALLRSSGKTKARHSAFHVRRGMMS